MVESRRPTPARPFAFVAALLPLLLLSCDLVGLIQPPYAGEWRGEDTTTGPIGGFQPLLELTLGREDFGWIDRIPDSSGKLADLFGMKGAAEARGSVITLSIDLVGQAPLDSGGHPAGALGWSEAGTPEYEEAVASLPSTVLEARYEISGAVMTLIPDSNGDGAFDDRDPLLTLTKQ